MTTSGQFQSPARQVQIAPYETSERAVVGYAMDYPAGLVTGMHSHPKAQLIYAVTGVMRIETEGATYAVPPTTAVYMASNTQHSIRMEGVVAQRQLFLGPALEQRSSQRLRVVGVSALLRELVIAICEEGPAWRSPNRARHLAALAALEIGRAPDLPLALTSPQDHRVSRITSALARMPSDTRTLGDWSSKAGASERTLARLFIQETGLTFGQWRQNARLIEAYAALSVGVKPAVIAAAVGYDSLPAFGAAFRKHFGRTPGSLTRK